MQADELELPIDFHSRGEVSELRDGASFELDLPSGGVSPERLLLALFCAQLFRYSGQARLSLGFSKHGSEPARNGFWSLEVGLTGDSRLRDILEQLAEQLAGPASPAGAAHARAVVSWIESEGLARAKAAHSSTDLTVLLTSTPGALRATLLYNPGCFKAETVERFAGHLRTLASAAGDLDQTVARLPLLTAAERLELESAGDGRVVPVSGERVHQSVERQARARPDAVAVRYRDQAMTFRELNQRANRVARHLHSRGISAEDRIIVRMVPTGDVLVGLLGILKAGAVYVPIDPTYPEARIQAILDDTRPALILTGDSLRELENAAAGCSSIDPELPILPDQTAYIYYTSGTTGRPKGAMASQANLASYVEVARVRYGFADSDIMPAIARLSFSISMFELMTPLVSGGTVVVLDRDHVMDPARMARTLSESTIFHAGPSLLKGLIPYIRRAIPDFCYFSKIRHASSGGDLIAPEVLEGLKEIFASAEIFVIYGCSEIACMGCTYPVPRERKVDRTFVGRPFDNVGVRVFDGSGNLVPAGIVGEIYFSGGGVVKGYLNLDDLTQEKFVEHQGRRYYRTGDQGRFSADGWLEILGRSDFQVKLRGMRVELGEVEYHLQRAPGVRDGVAAAQEAAGGEKILAAYFVAEPGAAIEGKPARVSAIRKYLEERLPDYMVPGVFVELERLPLNHNLKLDRKALPAPREADFRAQAPGWKGEGKSGGTDLREAETPTEMALAALWKRFLKLERVGLDDRFFDLGGYSLLAMELLVALESELGITLNGMDVLRETLEVQAAICDERLGRKPAARRPRASAPLADDRSESFYFGAGSGLYGVFQQASSFGGRDTGRALLICPPPGVESVRSGFVIRQLKRKLAADGIHSMHFDYFGCGDSQGPSWAETLCRWEQDVEDACAELRRRSGATRIIGLGVRLGATLLCRAGQRLGISELILWDPVRTGSEYLAQLTSAQQGYLRAQVRGGGSRVDLEEGARELLGMTYSEKALGELRGLALEPPAPGKFTSARWLATSRSDQQRAHFQAWAQGTQAARLEVLDLGHDWCDVARVDQNFSDAGISQALAKLIEGDA